MSYYSSMNAASGRREEKEDMKRLADNLAQYIQRVRALGQKEGFDSPQFLDEFRSLEDAAKNLNAMYERELEDLRRELEEAKREKNENRGEADRHKKRAEDCEDKLRAEQGKANQLMGDNHELQRRVAQLERELHEAHAQARGPQTQVAQLESQVNNMNGRNHELENKLAEETVKRKQTEDKLNNLQKKLDFNDQLHKEQMKDAADRLEQATKAMQDLDNRARELERQGATYPELLEKIRQKHEQDMQAHKNDVEDTHRKNMADLKARLDNQAGTIAELRAANARLQQDNDKLQDKIRELEGRVRDLQKQKAAYEDLVNKERVRGADQVRAMEKKLKDLQDLLYARMQEANIDKDANLSLKAEIRTMQEMLAEENNRLKTSVGHSPYTSMNRPQLSTSYKPSDRLGNVTSASLNDKSRYMYSGADADSNKYMYSGGVDQNKNMYSSGTMGAGDTKGQDDGGPAFMKRAKDPMSEYMDRYTYRGPFTHRGELRSSLNEHNLAYQQNRSQTMTGLPKIESRQASGTVRYGQVY